MTKFWESILRHMLFLYQVHLYVTKYKCTKKHSQLDRQIWFCAKLHAVTDISPFFGHTRFQLGIFRKSSSSKVGHFRIDWLNSKHCNMEWPYNTEVLRLEGYKQGEHYFCILVRIILLSLHTHLRFQLSVLRNQIFNVGKVATSCITMWMFLNRFIIFSTSLV